MSEELPQRIGRYGVWSEIGRDSSGVVYEAYDPELERSVALKAISAGSAVAPGDREAFEARFFGEARVAARLSHPGIMAIHDTGRDPDTGLLFIVLERLKGRTLAQLLQEGPLAWRLALQIAGDIAEALHHAHGQGVIHRDVNPANIMVLPDGEPKVMGFGIAGIASFGTPLYMSPEQALGGSLDHRTDLFALGAVLYETLTGQPAFAAATPDEIIANVVGKDPPPASGLVSGLPPEVDYVLARALAKDCAFRYPHGRTITEDVADILAGHAPRHREDWQPAPPAALPPKPTRSASSTNPFSIAVPPPAAAHRRPAALRGRLAVAAVGLAGIAVGVAIGAVVTVSFWRAKRPLPPVSIATPFESARPAPAVPGEPTPQPIAPPSRASSPLLEEPTPASVPLAAPRPARLVLELEHSLETGRLRLWVDDTLSLETRLDSESRKKLLVLKGRRGSVVQTLDVAPGEHQIRVEVAWEGNLKTKRLAGTFRPGATRRIAAKLGGLLKRNLSLEWQ